MKFRMFKGGDGLGFAVNVDLVKSVHELPRHGKDGCAKVCEIEYVDGSTVDVSDDFFTIVSRLNTIAE